ncbi:MAG: insulinase family protein, partial [Gemmataceae bacterium]|nr:insulinase family protein [Gemmataceae bacterium]
GCSFHEYDGTGVYYTSMSCEPEKAAGNTAILKRVLAEVQASSITEEELSTAKSKLLSRLVRSGERPRGRLVPVGMHWTYQGEYRSVDDDLRAYEAVTLADVRAVIDKYPLTKLTTLTLGPLESLET